MEYTLKELEKWATKIEKKVSQIGLNCYNQEFETINYDQMLAYEAYAGMPSMYAHWSFGKSFEKLKTLYKYNFTGLPYEIVINSNPCMAYLLKNNTLLLQILTMAHVYGHNDFFKNNRLFKQDTDARYTVEMFKNHADIIRNYINDNSIGYLNVEKTLNVSHALKFQRERVTGIKKLSYEKIHNSPVEYGEDILCFISEFGELYEWEKNIIHIVREQTKYFTPQMETKIMNEGWASFWHYNILKHIGLSNTLYLEFIKRHNDVVVPSKGSINPYYLGFKIFSDIEEKYGLEKIFEVREIERDESFLRKYLTKELCQELNLYKYVKKDKNYIVEEISDEDGWEKIRDSLCSSCGLNIVPCIKIVNIDSSDKTMILKHEYDGRELDMNYTIETMRYIVQLWKRNVKLITYQSGKEIAIICNEKKKISYE